MLCGMSDAENPKTKSELTTEPEVVETPPETTDLAETQELAPEDRPEAAATPAERQVVYVHAPVPPKVVHNRLFGALLALLGTAVYGALYAVGAAVIIALTPGVRLDASFLGFVNNSAFWVPIVFYVVSAVVAALLLNRAAWWAHVIASAIVALIVYWGSAGLLTLLTDLTQQTPDEAAATFWAFAGSPILFVAAILAREVAMWVGLAISVRGRKARMRNADAKAAYDAEQAEKKAEYERAATTV
jgi:hypothetical protein